MKYISFSISRILFLLALPLMLSAKERASFTVPNSTTYKITSGSISRSYSVYVKTPYGYDEPKNAHVTYPVIYLNDGPYTFPIASGVTRLPMGASNKFNRAILVGISFAEGESGVHSRVRDLTPVEDRDWIKFITGGGPAYFEFIHKKVMPFIESKYRIDQTKRTLSGQSLGGLFGVWVLLEHPEVFSSYILTSPSLWYKNKYIFELEKKYASTHQALNAKVYFAVGEKETIESGMKHPMVSQLIEFADVLNSRKYQGLELKVEIISDAIHETTFPQGFTRGVHWIFGRQ